MNQKVDFLIRYEHKIRELESVMLLKLELERRGYTVGLVCNYEHRHDYEPKVLIVPAGYYTEHFMYEMCKYSIRKIANLQLEQLFQSRNEENLILLLIFMAMVVKFFISYGVSRYSIVCVMVDWM